VGEWADQVHLILIGVLIWIGNSTPEMEPQVRRDTARLFGSRQIILNWAMKICIIC
jgi:hypothetical protein